MHQKALSTTVTLEEEIEKLHRMKAHSGSEWRHRDRDSQRPEERRRKRWHQVGFSSQLTPSWSADPDMPSGRMGSKGRDSDLGEPLQLKEEVASFLQGSSETPEDKDEEMLPEPYPSLPNRCDGGLRSVMSLTSGWNYLQFCRKTQESWPKRWELCFNSQGVCMKWTLGRPHSMHPQLHHVSTNRGSCPPWYLLLLARTSEKFPGRRQSLMPKLCSASWSKITHQGGTSHAFWWRA